MPTSYTTNFRLALPATGELSGTWGNTVNTAITSLVDSMESQSTISVTTASQALTANNGVADQARSLYLSFSQLGVNATYTVYAPPVQKMYVVYNSDPTYNLVFAVSNAVNSTTPSGGSTATIAPLQRVTLYNDGVNIIPLFNTVLGSLTSGAIAGTTGTFSGAVSGLTVNATSDRRKKTNIRKIEGALEIIKQLNGVRFDYKDSGLHSAGLIAQDVERQMPELVVEVDGVKNLNYNGIIGVLVEAIKDLCEVVGE
jgi:hypothetical protein